MQQESSQNRRRALSIEERKKTEHSSAVREMKERHGERTLELKQAKPQNVKNNTYIPIEGRGRRRSLYNGAICLEMFSSKEFSLVWYARVPSKAL